MERGDLSSDENDSRFLFSKDPDFTGLDLRHVEAVNLLAIAQSLPKPSEPSSIEFYANLKVIDSRTGKVTHKRVVF